MNNSKDIAKKAIEDHKERFNAYWDNAKYTKSIVAFIDVMGTKDLFSEDLNDFDTHKAIYKAWAEVASRQFLPEYKKRLNSCTGILKLKAH